MTDNLKDLIEQEQAATIIRSLLEVIAGQQALLEKKDEALALTARELTFRGCETTEAAKALVLTSPTDALEQAILKEREACAKKAERMVNGKAIAAAIRARGGRNV